MKNYKFKKFLSIWLMSICLVFPFDASHAKGFDDSITPSAKYPEWFRKTPFNDLAEIVGETKAQDKQGLMVVYGTQGCSYCELFARKSLGNPGIASIVKRNFESVSMEIFDDAEMVTPAGESMSIKQFASKERIEFSPSLLFYDNEGRRILRVVGYQSPERFKHIINYVTKKYYTTLSLRDYFKKQKKTKDKRESNYTLKSDYLFSKPPYILERVRITAGQPLVVLFEKNGCEECDDFHKDVLALNKVRRTLKEFDVVRLDATDNKTPVRMPNGRLTTPAAWYKRLDFSRLPALVFFSQKGEKVLETDALVKQQRMMNSMNFVLERAYEKDWTYQRFARAKGIEKNLKKLSRN